MKQKLQQLQFEVHLVDHCNLNCQMCDHFSPLAEKYFLCPEEYECDIRRLSQIFNHQAKYIRLLGGEPLLHPQIVRFIQISRLYFPDTNLELYTNGLLLPKQTPDFWNACREFSTVIAVTKYPIDFDYTQVESLAQNNNVKLIYIIVNDEVEKTSWHLPLDLKGKQDPIGNFFKCDMGNVCIFLKHGNLYPCTVAPNAIHFNHYFNKNIHLSDDDCINIYHADADDILEFLKNPIPFCKYCDIERRKENILWSTSQKKISEWT